MFGLGPSRYRELVLAAHKCGNERPVEVIEDLHPEQRIVLRSDAALTEEGRLRLRSILLAAATASAEGLQR